MICVSIGRGRHRHVIAEHKHLADNGVTLVELRLDYIQGEVQVKRLLKERAADPSLPPRSVILPTEYIRRASCGPPRAV